VRHLQHFNQQAKRRLTALLIFAAALSLFIYPLISSRATAIVQQKRRAGQGQPARPATSRASAATSSARDRSRFLHDKNHVTINNRGGDAAVANCDSCHTIRTPTQYEIKDYPDHDSCLRCHETHRRDFFTGARPVICTICHVKNFSPRNGARLDFPGPRADISSEFKGYFPHGKHQDIIARRRQPGESDEGWRLLRASFSADDKPRELENCATCHSSYDGKAEQQLFARVKWPQAMLLDKKSGLPEGMEVDDGSGLPRGTFKKIPEGWDGHQTCFVCHGSTEKSWMSPQPVATNCAGCHLPVNQEGVRQMAQSPAVPRAAARGARDIAAAVDPTSAAGLPRRRVFRFQHDVDKQGHDIGCTACHINITQETTLSIPRPDVPITSCAVCHLSSSQSSLRKGESVTIKTEMEAWLKQKDSSKCVGCHALEITGKDIPCDHYYAAFPGEPAQQPCRP
jgi:hypothetical protein